MDDEKLVSAAKDELQLVLSFFARAESKSSVVLAIDTAMLAFLAANAPAFSDFSKWLWISSAATVLLLAASIGMLYKGSFPNLDGGEASLVYFREIAKKREHQFITEFCGLNSKNYAHDLLAQAWRNSQILSIKFDCLKWAFRLMAVAILPWLVCLVFYAAKYGSSHPVKP